MRARYFLIAMSFVCGLGATGVSTAAPGLGERETAIYNALINHGLGADVALVVIAAETTGDPAAIGEQEDAPGMLVELGLPARTLTDWRQRNAAQYPIEQALDLKVTYNMMDATTRAQLFDGAEPRAGWQKFFERYPGAPGLLRLSRVGFDDSLQHAMVYIEHHCGVDCGSGRIVHLANDPASGWHVEGAALVWMAE